MSVENTLGALGDRHRLKVALFAIVEDVRHHDSDVATCAIHSLTSLIKNEGERTEPYPLRSLFGGEISGVSSTDTIQSNLSKAFGVPLENIQMFQSPPPDWQTLLENARPDALEAIGKALDNIKIKTGRGLQPCVKCGDVDPFFGHSGRPLCLKCFNDEQWAHRQSAEKPLEGEATCQSPPEA